MTTTTTSAMPIHNPDNVDLPGAPLLKPEKKKKKDRIKANMLKRLNRK